MTRFDPLHDSVTALYEWYLPATRMPIYGTKVELGGILPHLWSSPVPFLLPLHPCHDVTRKHDQCLEISYDPSLPLVDLLTGILPKDQPPGFTSRPET